MEKLTEYVDGKYIRIKGTKSLYPKNERDGTPLSNAIASLAAYEETGLEPEDMKKVFNEDATLKLAGQILGVTPGRLRELAQADKVDEIGKYRFYYCESKDEYLIGARLDTFYYARWDGSSFTWSMSRFLPWGKHVVAPETAWKEYTYPSEPKEIGMSEWFKGFLGKLTREAAEAALKEREAEHESNV